MGVVGKAAKWGGKKHFQEPGFQHRFVNQNGGLPMLTELYLITMKSFSADRQDGPNDLAPRIPFLDFYETFHLAGKSS